MGLCCCKERKHFEENDPTTQNQSADNNNIRAITNEPIQQGQVNIQRNEILPLSIKKSLEYSAISSNSDRIIFDNDTYDDLIVKSKSGRGPMPHLCFYDQIKTNFYLRVCIEFIDVFYKQCDDFGLLFKPYIEVFLSGHEHSKIMNIDEEKLNNSGISEDYSFTSDNTDNTRLKTRTSFITSNVTILKDGKNYSFKYSKNYELVKSSFYSTLVIKVKNESNLGLNLVPVIIGEARIPLNMIYKKSKEQSFDGLVEFYCRNNTFIGHIKVSLNLSLQNFENDELLMKLANKKILDDIDFEHENIFEKKTDTWASDLMHYSELDHEIIEKYFIFDLDCTDIMIESVKKFNSEIYENNEYELIRKRIDSHLIYKAYKEAIDNENFILLYEIFISLIKITIENDFTLINEFFKILSNEEKKFFYTLPEFTEYNVYFIKLFLIFIWNYQKYFKSNLSITIRNNKELDDVYIIDSVVEVLKKVAQRALMNEKVINEEYSLEMKTCVEWCITNLNEVITLSSDLIRTKTIKAEIDENKAKEFNLIYNNGLHLISKRINILKVMEIYIDDSQIVAGIIRMFRKLIQILTTDSNSIIDKSKDAKTFSREFRKLLVYQNEGFFIICLRAVFNKFYHYTEIHNNILIILFQITNYLDTENLILTANNLNLEEFKKHFDPYRSRVRAFCKLLNSLHLNILANLSKIAISPNYNEYEGIMKFIMLDLKAYYRNNQSNKKRLEEFQLIKLYEVEIQEIVTRIALNISKYFLLSYSLAESYFFDDMIEYIQLIANTSNKDYIQQVAEKKRKSVDEVKGFVLAIVENTLMILINIVNNDKEDLSDILCNRILAEHGIDDAEQLCILFETCKNVLLKYGCSVKKLEINLDNLKDCFEL